MKRYDFIGEGGAVIFTALQTQEVWQIISLVLTCVSIAVSLAFTLYKWYKEAKKDGKIDKNEIEEATNIAKEKADEIIQTVEAIKEAKEKINRKDK